MHITWETFAIVLPFIFLAGLVDSIAGGGGLISLPAYLAAGLPTHYALGNNKFSSAFGTFFSTLRYFKHKVMDVPVAMISAVCALAGSFAGTRTVLLIRPDFLNFVLIVLIPVIAVFTLLNKRMGEQNHSASIEFGKRMFLGSAAGMVVGFYDGFFGPGTGVFLILIYTLLVKYDFVTANGNTKAVNLASNIASLVTFVAFGRIIYLLAVPAAIAGIAGNLIGSKLAVTKGAKVIRPVFILALVILFSKVLFDTLKKFF